MYDKVVGGLCEREVAIELRERDTYKDATVVSLQKKLKLCMDAIKKRKRNKAKALQSFLQEDFVPPQPKQAPPPSHMASVHEIIKENKVLKRKVDAASDL